MNVDLTETGRNWLQDHHPQALACTYDNPFKLICWATEFIEITYLGIHYRIPPKVDGKLTIKKAAP